MTYPYEYLLKVWGGSIQELGLEDKLNAQWFSTKEEREKEKERIILLADSCKNKGLAICEREGYLTRHNFIIKSLVKDKTTEEYHWVINELGYGFFTEEELADNAKEYMLDWKWGISPPDEVDLDNCILLDTSLIIEEPKTK